MDYLISGLYRKDKTIGHILLLPEDYYYDRYELLDFFIFFKQDPYDNGLSVKEFVEEYDGFFTYLRIYEILEELNEIKKTNNDLLNYLFNNEDTRLIKEIAEDVMYSFGITKFRDPKRYDKHNL